MCVLTLNTYRKIKNMGKIFDFIRSVGNLCSKL